MKITDKQIERTAGAMFSYYNRNTTWAACEAYARWHLRQMARQRARADKAFGKAFAKDMQDEMDKFTKGFAYRKDRKGK